MNNKVYFMNNGTFDLRGMLTFGLSAKVKDDAIGFFGTGFKYAVAIILRNLGTIKITTKGEDGNYYMYEFFAKRENFRGKDTDFIFILDHTTGESISANITTRVGINWKHWMAFRELYCNCKDEEGVISTEYQEGFDTVIEVDCAPIYQAFQEKDSYILPEMEPIFKTGSAEIYERKLPYVYYRGIAVYSAQDDAAYTYNILDYIELTEDRTVKYEFYVRSAIQKVLQLCDVDQVIEQVVQDNCFEAKQGFDKDWPVSDKFIEVCDRLQNTDKGIRESARLLVKTIKIKRREFPEFTPNAVQQKMIDKAKSFLLKMDMPIDQYPIKYVTGLGDGVMGRALDGTIYISEMPFNMGTKQLASTLMEEWVHLKTGAHDFDRTMQSWLFDKILSVGETINGEPI